MVGGGSMRCTRQREHAQQQTGALVIVSEAESWVATPSPGRWTAVSAAAVQGSPTSTLSLGLNTLHCSPPVASRQRLDAAQASTGEQASVHAFGFG